MYFKKKTLKKVLLKNKNELQKILISETGKKEFDAFTELFKAKDTEEAMSNDGIESDSVEMFVISDQLVIM